MSKSNVLSDGFINLGRIVNIKQNDRDLQEGTQRKAIQLNDNVEVIVRQTNFNGSIIERTFKPKSYFNLDKSEDSARKRFGKNPEALQRQLDFIKKYPHITHEISAAPSKKANSANYAEEDETEVLSDI